MPVSAERLALAVALEQLARVLREPPAEAPPASSAAAPVPPLSWRERLWSCPPETRLGVRELAEALGRPRSFVYRAARRGLPHRKLAGELTFIAGEVRRWVTEHEVAPGPAALVVSRPRKVAG